MNLLENTSLDGVVKEQLKFISKVTGKKITSLEVKKSEFKKNTDQYSHELKFSLDNYLIKLSDTLNYSDRYESWSDEKEFLIINNKEKIYEERCTSTTFIPTAPLHNTKESDLIAEVNRSIVNTIGDMHVDTVSLYDYESFVFDDFKKSHVYGSNLYRIMLALMKDEGKSLPPMLVKEPFVGELMENGEVEKLDKLLLSKINNLDSKFEQFAFDHMIFERDRINKYTQHKKDYLNPNILLSEKAKDISSIMVPGETYKDKINILVVEDFGDYEMYNASIGILAEKLSVDLAKTRKYDGVTIYRSFNLSECMWLCDTGQINMILLDGKGNNMSETMAILNAQGISAKITQGDNEINPDMYGGHNEKERWMKRIYSSLEEKNMSKPPYLILPSNFMDIDLSILVKGILPMESKFSKEEETFSNKYTDELLEAYDLESAIDIACGNKFNSESILSYLSKATKRNIQQKNLTQQMNWAKKASPMGNNLSKEDFDSALYSFINQNIPRNLEHITPSSLMEGLQQIDMMTKKYKEYMKEEYVREELNYEFYSRLMMSATQIDDSSFFTSNARNLSTLGNLTANTYIILKKMNEINNEIYCDSNNDKKNLPIENHDTIEEPDTVEGLVNNIIFSALAMAKTFKTSEYYINNEMSEFLLTYSKKIAEVSNSTNYFDTKYKQLFEDM